MARLHGCYGHSVPRVPTDKPTGKPISVPLIATTFYRDNEHNNQIEIDNLGGKRVLDNTRRGDDGQHEASRPTEIQQEGGARDHARQAGGRQREASDARRS